MAAHGRQAGVADGLVINFLWIIRLLLLTVVHTRWEWEMENRHVKLSVGYVQRCNRMVIENLYSLGT